MRLTSTQWIDLDSGMRITSERIHQDSGVLRFAVRDNFGSCVTHEGKLLREPLPSYRTEEFYNSCRFDDFESAAKALENYLSQSEVA